MKKLNYIEIAKALISDASKKGMGTHFDFSNMNKLAEQLEEMFVLRWGKEQTVKMKNVVEYIKNL